MKFPPMKINPLWPLSTAFFTVGLGVFINAQNTGMIVSCGILAGVSCIAWLISAAHHYG